MKNLLLIFTLLFTSVFLSPNVVLSHTPDFIEYIKTYFRGETETVVLSVDWKDLVDRNGIHYKKFSDVPFSGVTSGRIQGTYKNGIREGAFVSYWENGQLLVKGNHRNNNKEGVWVGYNERGYEDEKLTGTFKNGKKISD